MPAKLTEAEVQRRIAEIKQRGITMLDPFETVSAVTRFKCDICERIWKSTLNTVYGKNSRCPDCASPALTEKEVERRLAEIKARGITMLGSYKGMLIKTHFSCDVCNYIWPQTLNSIWRGQGCGVCAGKVVAPAELDRRLATLKARGITMLTPYKGVDYSAQFYCDICTHEWTSCLGNVYGRRQGCARCDGQYLSPLDIENKVKELLNRNIKFLGKYKRSSDRYDWLCLAEYCGNIWHSPWNSVVWNKTGCPRCAGKQRTQEEKRIVEAGKILRSRLGDLFYKGATPLKVYKNADGTNNVLYNELRSYWANEHKFIPTKPNTNDNWELDHIIPFSWFSPYDLEEQKLCWNRRNFQWLTESENSSKGNKVRLKDLVLFTDWHYQAYAQCSYPKLLPKSSKVA